MIQTSFEEVQSPAELIGSHIGIEWYQHVVLPCWEGAKICWYVLFKGVL